MKQPLNENDLILNPIPIFSMISYWLMHMSAYFGVRIAISAQDPANFMSEIKQLQPTFLPVFPKMCLGIYHNVTQKVGEMGALGRWFM